MKLWRVDDVMTKDVVTVREETPYRDIVDLLISRRVSAVPVVDRTGELTGLVSEADLMHPGMVPAGSTERPRVTVVLRPEGHIEHFTHRPMRLLS